MRLIQRKCLKITNHSQINENQLITKNLFYHMFVIGKTLKLEGGTTTNQTGRVSVQQYGIWGRVCPNSWDDNDATVVCKFLGFIGGVAYKYSSSGTMRHFINYFCF